MGRTRSFVVSACFLFFFFCFFLLIIHIIRKNRSERAFANKFENQLSLSDPDRMHPGWVACYLPSTTFSGTVHLIWQTKIVHTNYDRLLLQREDLKLLSPAHRTENHPRFFDPLAAPHRKRNRNRWKRTLHFVEILLQKGVAIMGSIWLVPISYRVGRSVNQCDSNRSTSMGASRLYVVKV